MTSQQSPAQEKAPLIKPNIPPRSYRYVLALFFELQNLTELSVGGSATDRLFGSGVTENPVIKMPTIVYYKDNNGEKYIQEIVPYIPGSTLKGLLRSNAETIVSLDNSNASVSLIEVLKQLIKSSEQDAKAALGKYEVSEIVNKILARILNQYIDESIVNKLSSILREPDNFKEFINSISNLHGENNLRSFLEDKVGDDRLTDILNAVSPMIVSILRNYRVHTEVCNPVIEGLMCELPIPKYKIMFLKALSRKIGRDIEYPCRVCRLFGLPGYMSRLIVTDAWPLGVRKAILLLRTHIAIDRIKETVVQGKTFDIEYIAPGAEFGFIILYHLASQKLNTDQIVADTNNPADFLEKLSNIITEDIDKENLNLLKKIIEEIRTNGAWIGKRKTWGMGKIKIELESAALLDLYNQTKPLIQTRSPKDIINKNIEQGIPLPLKETISTFFNLNTGETK